MASVRIRIIEGCMARGEPLIAGEVLKVDYEFAHELISCARATFADAETAARFSGVSVIQWRDPDAEASRLLKRVVAYHAGSLRSPSQFSLAPGALVPRTIADRKALRMSDAIQIPREVLESRYNFVVRGDLEIDIVTVADHVATLIGTYAIPAIRIKGAERSYIGCVPWHSEFHEDFTEVFDASEAIQRTGAPGAPKCADLAS